MMYTNTYLACKTTLEATLPKVMFTVDFAVQETPLVFDLKKGETHKGERDEVVNEEGSC